MVAGWFITHIDQENRAHIPIEYLFPEGTQVIEESDSHEFRDGTALAAVRIPPEASENFAQDLQGRNFVETPITEGVPWALTGVSEAEAPLKITKAPAGHAKQSIWCFLKCFPYGSLWVKPFLHQNGEERVYSIGVVIVNCRNRFVKKFVQTTPSAQKEAANTMGAVLSNVL